MPTIKVRKYGNSVYIIYTHKLKIFKKFTGVKVEDKYWNLSAPKKNCPDYKNIILQITAMESQVLNASMKLRSMGLEPTVEGVRTEFYAQTKPLQPFWAIYDNYLNSKVCKPSTMLKADVYRKTLEYFCSSTGYSFNIDTWDKVVFGRFIHYLLNNQKMVDSTTTILGDL
jgi:hypothetical protein